MSNKKGIGASSGISIAKVFLLKEEELKIKKESSDSTKEITLLEKAIETTKKQIEEIKVIAAKNLGEETAAIFDAHLLVADDPAIKDEISNMIKNDNVSAPYATQQVSSNFIEMFSAMEDAYMKERAADVKDVCQRLIKNILGVKIPNLLTIKEEVIIAAKDLTPSETSQLNKKFVKGFITDIGGRTSHSAIMARTLEIPAIVGMGDVTSTVKDGQMIIMNGDTGEINLNPTAADIKKAEEGIKAIEKDNAELLKLIDKKATTTDGHSFKILANIGNPEEAELVKKYGGDGVGLFRSEFLYMDSAD
jgi:phosphotransferase system enzyme I (PtsI)